ncbi:formyl transferase [Cupriavidus sp. USMAA2-4]|uniref:formyltransferase family protein n=1 Tax=Cupriavidus sp. USMAA2-4 TaxID=876364 RepID=UPI0008A704A5|nr:formyltransferase family protein [Cupriavidus sp. USMAA2-4]AOY94932.1 formyl transferase [Cupriavidus sp. USMAA2-4]
MRFAFAGFDLWCGVFDAFVAAGWQPLAVFTMPVDNRQDFNEEVVARAQGHGVPVRMSAIRADDLRVLAEQGCEVLVVAGHAWRVPDWRAYLRHAVNFHPSPLPEGRGPYPLFRALLEARRAWAVSCHCLAPEFDAGEILAAEPVALSAEECHETFQLKLQLAAARLAGRVARDFAGLWQARRAQAAGSYWPRITDAERTLDFRRPVADNLRVARACGPHECIAPVLGGAPLYVRRAAGWAEPHAFEPGTIVHHYRRKLVVAARDGFVALLEWSALPAAARHGLGT